jgi:hypothetical protein
MVSPECFIGIILPAALWPGGWLSLYQKWVPEIFLGGGIRAKVLRITYSGCVFVALGIQHGNTHAPFCNQWRVPLYNIFPP